MNDTEWTGSQQPLTGYVLELTLGAEFHDSVHVTLRRAKGNDWNVLWRRELKPTDFGVPVHLTRSIDDDAFVLPGSLRELIATSLEGADPRQPFWIQLVEPFGYLGMVPWGRLLDGIIDAPVLRLPTLSLERGRSTESLQVAVLAPVPDPRRRGPWREKVHAARVSSSALVSSAEPTRPFPPARHDRGQRFIRRPPVGYFNSDDLESLVVAILEGSPRPQTTVHVVTTPWLFHDLKARWRQRDWPVRLHNPYKLAEKADATVASVPAADNFWLRLLVAAQGNEQADVVHLVSHASTVLTKSRLVFAGPLPGRTVDGSSRYVSLTALQQALDVLGAWSMCLTSPAGNLDVAQLRYVGAQIVEMRPGPLLFTDLARDPGCRDVRDGYAFMYAEEPAVPPRLQHSMLACEPHRVRDFPDDAGGLTMLVQARAKELARPQVQQLIADDTTPAWLAGAQRFIERYQVELAKLERDAPIGSRSDEGMYRADGVRQALTFIQEALARWAEDHGSPRDR